MKLLIITQKVDVNDPILGFFHRWTIEFSKYYENITVICLYKGKYDLPKNVRVLSLGKEIGESRIKYLFNFYKYILIERRNYDKVFVHMNQEYIILGGIFWRLFRKDIFMWRNHHSGSWVTDIASAFCIKVFCTSKFSYTSKYKKTVFMPVGVDIDKFKPDILVQRIPQSILSLGRISPSKKIDMLVDVILKMNDQKLLVSVYGDALPQDKSYHEELKKRAGDFVKFNRGITNVETIKVYSTYDIFINLSSSGMYDKTIFEAMACGCLILASNDNLKGQINDDFIFDHGNIVELIEKLKRLLRYSIEERERSSMQLREFASRHSLKNLADSLSHEII